MSKTTWTTRFFGTTRGRILELLCYAERTVTEMAALLNLTDNAIRAHLAVLERDGLVRPTGLRSSTRRPNVTYRLTPAGHRLFPKAYGRVLGELVEVLSSRFPPETVRELLLDAGHRLATTHLGDLKALDTSARLAKLADVLGPAATLRRTGDTIQISGCGCPLSSVVSNHPQLCDIVAALLSQILDKPVQKKCDQGESPSCCFEISPLDKPS